MARLRLKYVQSFGGYHYFRRRGSPRIPLPGIVGSQEFMEAYQNALAAQPVAIGASLRSKPGSVSSALAEYYNSVAWRGLGSGTQKERRTILEKFREQYGHKPLASVPKEFIVALLDSMTPHAGKNWLKAFRHFIRWCEARKLVRSDPTWGIRVKVPKSGGFHTWTEDEISQFEAYHPVGSKPRLALALGLYTAQRRGDVIRMGKQHIRGGVLSVRQQKTGASLTIPVHPQLQAILDATPTGHLTFLVTKTGKSYFAQDFSEMFGQWCDDAGLPDACVFHGLRKAASRRLAEAGCTAHEIMAITGHVTLSEVALYTKAVEQARMARSAMAKATPAEQIGSQSVKSDPVAVSNPLKDLQKTAG
jgi:integrase